MLAVLAVWATIVYAIVLILFGGYEVGFMGILANVAVALVLTWTLLLSPSVRDWVERPDRGDR